MNKFTNSFEFNEHSYYYCDLKKIFETYPILRKLPNSLKILLEVNIRNAKQDDINNIIDTFVRRNNFKEINFYPSRVIMQDFEGVPAIVDLASMRDEVKLRDGNIEAVNPQIMLDLVIDHSSNTHDQKNESAQKELKRNKERYTFIKWASKQFKNFSVIPPNSGVCNQVNLEYLSTMISAKSIDEKIYVYPETIIGRDSHSTMINALGVLGWTSGLIDVESAILGSSTSLNLPEVVGVEVLGSLVQGVSINDTALSLSNILKDHKVKGKLVEFYGSGLRHISVEDRATISRLVSNTEALCGYFGIDENTISFVEQTRGVDASLIKEYYIKQGLYNVDLKLEYDENIKFNLSAVRPIVSGPKRFQDKVIVEHLPTKLESFKNGNFIKDNDIVLATITSCSSTSNLSLLIQTALLAKKAISLGLNINSNIKRTISYGLPIVKECLKQLDLLQYFDKLGFDLVDSNCNTDYRNEDLIERVSMDIEKFNLNVSSITSCNVDFDGKSHPLIKSNWQMSPALTLAYCLNGNINFDITKEPISSDIYLSDIWPSIVEVNTCLENIDTKVFTNVYKDIFIGNESWADLEYDDTKTYNWDKNSTYIQRSSFFEDIYFESIEIEEAKILALLDSSITSDYLSPSGQIFSYSPAALYLESKGLKPDEFSSFGQRRGNSELMVRGVLSNIRLKNKMVAPKEGGYTKDFISGEVLPLYDFSLKMKEENRPLVLFAGSNYGIGKTRDWASKGVKLLGVKAIIAKSFDEIHKSDLIGMGILPLEFIDDDIESLSLKGDELISIKTTNILANAKIEIEIKKADEVRTIIVQSRLDSIKDVDYYKNNGVMNYLLKKII